MYTAAKNSLKAAMNTHPLNRLACVCWHEGETDADNLNANYITNLNAMYNALVTDVPAMTDAVPFVVGAIRGSTQAAGIPMVNNALANFARSKANVSYVEAGDLAILDTYHFSAPSLRTLGSRYAAALKDLQAFLATYVPGQGGDSYGFPLLYAECTSILAVGAGRSVTITP